MNPPCIVYEDEHLLVANKPAGLNTHSPSPFAGEGLYDWLRHQEARWAGLGIVHRLDKETSGIIVFCKSTAANRSLTDQFTRRLVRKKYLLVTDRPMPKRELSVRTALVRAGDRYLSRPIVAGSEVAETRFSAAGRAGGLEPEGRTRIVAEPFTGRTHQIRVHAADEGFPILGDVRYGGTPAPRLCLHAAEITFSHPVSGEKVTFRAPADFRADWGLALREALLGEKLHNACRLIHGAADGWPGWYVDRLGEQLLSQGTAPLGDEQRTRLALLLERYAASGAYHKQLAAAPGRVAPAQACPEPVMGRPVADAFHILENGVQFEVSFAEGYSFGLFLDQRDNRRRLLTGHVAAGFALSESSGPAGRLEILNTFAYTCGFSVAAAKGGARTTSLDLSKKYLEWGRRNFRLNQIDPAGHDFIFGDVFDWLRRLGKKERRFDVILLDPPTFSRSKQSGAFRAEQDYPKLASEAVPLLKRGGVLFAASNAAGWAAEAFLESLRRSIQRSNRPILQEQYFPQPPDFPISRAEPAYLKSVWLRLG